MMLKNINVLVSLFFLIIKSIKGDCEECYENCCGDLCEDCLKEGNKNIIIKEYENNKSKIDEEKKEKTSNNLQKNNSFMEDNNSYNNQDKNQNNNLLPQNNNLLPQNNLQNNVFQNKRVTTGETLGLQNVGATCYMNATLQCLFHIKELSFYFLDWYFSNCRSFFWSPFYVYNEYFKKKKLFAQYMNLLCQVFYPEYNYNSLKYYAPHGFKTVIGEINPLFKGIQANDAKDLLQFILETMHGELKQFTQNFVEYSIDQRDEQMAWKYFYDSYWLQNSSPVHDCLYGVNKIEAKCLNCKTIKYNYQSYDLLYFPLKEAKRCVVERKKKEDQNFNENNYTLILEDCFAYNEKIEKFVGDNQMYCNVCLRKEDAEYQTVLYTSPIVLSIVLNRGKANKDFQEDFKFGLDLDIKKYIYSPNCKHGKYYLIGMVVHSGGNGMDGHFIAYCRMDKKAKWFCYNDGWVAECNDIEKKLSENSPYILFYHYDNEV